MIHGNDLIIKLDGIAIAACKSCEITHECDTLSIAPTEYGSYVVSAEGKHTWKVSTSHLLSNVSDFIVEAGKTYTLSFAYRKNGVKVSGQAICTQCKVTATRGSMAQGSFEFQGTGALT